MMCLSTVAGGSSVLCSLALGLRGLGDAGIFPTSVFPLLLLGISVNLMFGHRDHLDSLHPQVALLPLTTDESLAPADHMWGVGHAVSL